MKKLIVLLMILVVVIALPGCAISQAADVPQETAEVQLPDLGEKRIETQETLLILKDVAQMFAPCSQLVSYMAIASTEIDMQNPVADDFWLILSMVTYTAKPDSIGEFGTIDLKEDVIKDIASTFFADMLEHSDIPSPDGTYSAAYIGAEALYELQPMSMSDMTAEMVSLEKSDSSEGKYLMTISLVDAQQRTQRVDWQVYLDDWEDGQEHFFPYQFVKAIQI